MNNKIFNFSGKYFLVTGASSGFGKATSILLSKYDAKLILVGRSKEKLEITYNSLSGNGHIIYPFDLENLDDSKNFFDDATPSGNAVAAKVLLRLGFLTGKLEFVDIAEQMLKSVNTHMKSRLDATTSLNSVVMEYLQPIDVVILRGFKNDLKLWQSKTRKLLKRRTICYAIPESE